MLNVLQSIKLSRDVIFMVMQHAFLLVQDKYGMNMTCLPCLFVTSSAAVAK